MSDLVLLPYRRTAGDLDPAEVITITFGGRTFRAGRRTAAHLEWTQEQLTRLHPGAWIRVLQPCYHEGYEPSAGTHDGDGVLDVEIVGLSWTEGQDFLRAHGWLDWWRHTGSWADRSDWHHHMISLGCPGPVGIYVPGQVIDGYHHTFGLKGQHNVDLDKSWWPGDVGAPPWPVGTTATWATGLDATYFDYPAWERAKEDDMGWNDWSEKDRKDAAAAIAAAAAPLVVKQLLGAFVDDGKTTLKAALRKASTVPGLVRKLGAIVNPRASLGDVDED